MDTASYVKDPSAYLDYYIDWATWLGGDTIETSTWTSTGTVTLDQDVIVGSMTQVWVAGGTVGEAVTLTNHIVTGQGREDDRSLVLIIRER